MKKSIVLIPLPSLIKNSFVRSFVLSVCEHTMQQTLATLDVNIKRAHTASFAAVFNRLALLEAANS